MFSFDTKFWRTLIPLLVKPGKVTKDYKEGKRSRYSNPFRFYITASILFFLVLGFSNNFDNYQSLAKEEVQKKLNVKDTLQNTEIKTNSIKKLIEKEIDESIHLATKDKQKKEILKNLTTQVKDTIQREPKNENNFSFNGTRLGTFLKYQKKHKNATINEALDSLKYPKDFKNRFLYQRSKTMSQVFNDQNSANKFLGEVLSYSSISLFVFLPIFSLFLRIFYIRRKYSYVDHLIFVFHTQTVFFMLLTIVTILGLFAKKADLWIFGFLFLIYLFLAMKKFYQQGFFKTFVKFLMLNFVYLIMASVGVLLVFLVSFAIY